jgi:hypothetical protein
MKNATTLGPAKLNQPSGLIFLIRQMENNNENQPESACRSCGKVER